MRLNVFLVKEDGQSPLKAYVYGVKTVSAFNNAHDGIPGAPVAVKVVKSVESDEAAAMYGLCMVLTAEFSEVLESLVIGAYEMGLKDSARSVKGKKKVK